MPIKFKGDEGEFIRTIESLELEGDWHEIFDGTGLRYRTKEGDVIMWYQTTNSVLVMGNRRIEPKLTELINNLALIEPNEY